MSELTLESLARRVEALEKELTEQRVQNARKKDWRQVVGIIEDNEFTRDWVAETLAIRERERQAAREGRAE